MKIPKIEYNVYYPFYENNLTQLNLSICNNMDIDIYIPVDINDSLYKHNSSSDYYNNVCLKATSNSGTDISLTDRKKEFINNNMTLCEEDCNLIEYNYTIKKAKCSCIMKINIPLLTEIKFDKNKLYQSFTDINNIANFNLIFCYKIVFQLRNLLNNYYSFFNAFLLILYFITLFIFLCKGYPLLRRKINRIKSAKSFILKRRKNKKQKQNAKTKKYLIKKNLINNESRNSKRNIGLIGLKTNKKRNYKFSPPSKTKQKKSLFDYLRVNKVFSKKNNNNITTTNEPFYNTNKIKSRNNGVIKRVKNANNNKKKKINKKNRKLIIFKRILKYNDSELNFLTYKKALLLDKRGFFLYYLSLLKSGNLLFFSFYCDKRDYNSQFIKIFLFFFFFNLYLTTNALFFNDNTMHKILIDEGSYNIIYNIPQILYSTLISAFITTIIEFLSLSEKRVIAFKQDNNCKNLNLKYKKLLYKLKIQYIFFFIFSFLFSLSLGYYNICFCGIYENTQLHLIKDTAISFGLSLLYPFIIYLFPSMLRICALRAKKKNKNYLFMLSTIIQKI